MLNIASYGIVQVTAGMEQQKEDGRTCAMIYIIGLQVPRRCLVFCTQSTCGTFKNCLQILNLQLPFSA